MRLGTKRHIYIKSSRSHKRASLFLFIMLLFAFLFFILAYFLQVVRPVILRLAENQSTVIAEQSVSKALGSLFQDVSYEDFITISRLEDGTVSSLEANLSDINRLRSMAAAAIQEAISATRETELHLPLGSVSGHELLAGMGPTIPVRLTPFGRSVVNFKSNFSAVGVNQTRLEIYLQAKTTVDIVLPLARISRQITTDLPIIQTIIVGKVPDNYVNIDRMGEEYEGDVLDLIG